MAVADTFTPNIGFTLPGVDGPAQVLELEANWTKADALFGQVVNVRHPIFGAVGDGTTDDTAAIQAALTAVSVAGGGTVVLPRGTYRITAMLVGGSKTTVQGAGQGATIVKQGSAANLASLLQFTSKSFVHVRDLTFDGNKAQNTTRMISLFFVACTDVAVEQCEFANNPGGSPVPGVALGFGSACERVLVQGNYVHDAGTLGSAASDGIYTGGRVYRIVDNLIVAATDTAIVFEATSTSAGDPSDNTVIAHNTIKDTPQGIAVDAAIASTYGAGVVVQGNTLEGCSAVNGGSIYVYRSSGTSQAQVVVQGNVVRGSTDGHGIYCDRVDDLQVVGNLCADVSLTQAKHGILVIRCSRAVVSGNVVRRSGGQGISVQGLTDGVVSGNVVTANNQAGGSLSGIDVRSDGAGVESSGVLVVGNRCTGTPQARGITVADVSTDVLIALNDCRGNVTAAYANASSGEVRRMFNLFSATPSAIEAIDQAELFGRVQGDVILPNATGIKALTTGSVPVNLVILTADASNITRFVAGVDAGGFQWTNQAQSVVYADLLATGLHARVPLYPPTAAGVAQSVCGLRAGNGVPSNADGADGEFFFRGDGGAMTAIYQKRAGSWVGIV